MKNINLNLHDRKFEKNAQFFNTVYHSAVEERLIDFVILKISKLMKHS